jgi:hypothetical protein
VYSLEPEKNGLAGWPDGWPQYFNGLKDPCDMAIGPCACGAWHQEGEFEFVKNAFGSVKLYRYGEEVKFSFGNDAAEEVEHYKATVGGRVDATRRNLIHHRRKFFADGD